MAIKKQFFIYQCSVLGIKTKESDKPVLWDIFCTGSSSLRVDILTEIFITLVLAGVYHG